MKRTILLGTLLAALLAPFAIAHANSNVISQRQHARIRHSHRRRRCITRFPVYAPVPVFAPAPVYAPCSVLRADAGLRIAAARDPSCAGRRGARAAGRRSGVSVLRCPRGRLGCSRAITPTATGMTGTTSAAIIIASRGDTAPATDSDRHSLAPDPRPVLESPWRPPRGSACALKDQAVRTSRIVADSDFGGRGLIGGGHRHPGAGRHRDVLRHRPARHHRASPTRCSRCRRRRRRPARSARRPTTWAASSRSSSPTPRRPGTRCSSNSAGTTRNRASSCSPAPPRLPAAPARPRWAPSTARSISASTSTSPSTSNCASASARRVTSRRPT